MNEVLALVAALVVIIIAAELFTNSIEWFGKSLNLAEGAVGSVLAAVGTALPETMIPLVAILFSGGGHDAGHEIGVGAILGAPFMLSTMALFLTGLGVIAWRRRRARGSGMAVDNAALGMAIRYFFVAYAIAVAAAFVPTDLVILRYVAVAAVLLLYANYVRRHLEADPTADAEELEPLHFRPLDRRRDGTDPAAPRLRVISLQVLVALIMIIGGAAVFVDAVGKISVGLGLDAALLALIIAPIATELPETFNSLIWVRNGKDTLALGNITGAMVFQASIPTAIGILLASQAWTVTPENVLTFASAGIAFAATASIFLPMLRRGSLGGRHLLVGGLFYSLFVGLVVVQLAGLW